jgi:predicted ATP-grasp superfamily ATP-dependent carboligase
LWYPIFGNKGFQVDGPADLERRLAQVAPHQLQVLVQSLVIGPTTNQYTANVYMDESSRLLGLFTTWKLRQYPVDFGVSTFRASKRLAEVERLAQAFLTAIGYHGLGCVEFKRDQRDGQFKLIELNARLSQANSHGLRCGLNLPLISFLDLTGQNPEPLTTFTEGVRWLYATRDFEAFCDYHRSGELDWLSWLRSVATARSFALLDWHDPLPFLAAHEYGLKFARFPRYLLRHRRTTP